jgi:hypothetical protein
MWAYQIEDSRPYLILTIALSPEYLHTTPTFNETGRKLSIAVPRNSFWFAPMLPASCNTRRRVRRGEKDIAEMVLDFYDDMGPNFRRHVQEEHEKFSLRRQNTLSPAKKSVEAFWTPIIGSSQSGLTGLMPSSFDFEANLSSPWPFLPWINKHEWVTQQLTWNALPSPKHIWYAAFVSTHRRSRRLSDDADCCCLSLDLR